MSNEQSGLRWKMYLRQLRLKTKRLEFSDHLTVMEMQGVRQVCVCVSRVFVFSSPGIESSLESQPDMESTGQQSDDASLPSTSQDPGNIFCLLNIISTLTA